jgi:cytochrome c553
MKRDKLLAVVLAALPAVVLAAAPASPRDDLKRATQATPSAERGSELFTQCVSCHGGRGGGQENGNTPRIAGQHYSVLLKQLVDFRHGRRWDFRMEEYANQHHLEGPQDIADVAFYVNQLDAGQARGTGDGSHATDGARIFGTRCASCHGASGRGDARKVVPQLAGQHYSYLVRQMYDAVDGRRPTLQKVHPPKIEPLDFAQVRAVADYLSRVDWDPPNAASANP